MRFVGVDFETANPKRDSACSIGLAVVEDGQIKVHHHLIRPPSMHFDPNCVQVHGITPSMVRNAPTFKELYPTIRPMLEHGPLWAHNSAFERSVFKALGETYGIHDLELEIDCTVKLSKRLFPRLERHGLDVVCEHLGLKMKHHDAGDDAWASAQIVLHAHGLIERGEWHDPTLNPFVVPPCIRGSIFAIAGEFKFGSKGEVLRAFQALGAHLEPKMRRETPYLLIGERGRSHKARYDQAVKYIANGSSIRVVKEADFWTKAKEERRNASS